MPQATKVVIHFDDGSTYEVQAASFGSLFTSEAKAKKCGHNPPYGKPPGAGAGAVAAADDSGTCYLINGVIICP